MKVRWSRPAAGDLEQIGDYIAADNPLVSAQTVRKILDQAELLAENPHLGRAGRVAGSRELVITGPPYIVVYRVVADTVEILAVFHGARRWPLTPK